MKLSLAAANLGDETRVASREILSFPRLRHFAATIADDRRDTIAQGGVCVSIVVPEAWSLDRIRTVVDAVANGFDAGEQAELSDRHVNYHEQAARELGWLRKTPEGHEVTAAGRRLLATVVGSGAEVAVMREAVLACPVVANVIPTLLDGVNTSQVSLALQKHSETKLAKTTANKRAGYLLKWAERLSRIAQADSTSRAQPTGKRPAKRSVQDASTVSSPPEPTSRPKRPHGEKKLAAEPPVQPSPPQSSKANDPPILSDIVRGRVDEQSSYRGEIRHSQIQELLEKVKKRSYQRYLLSMNLSTLRGFSSQTVTFDFPVTALIGPNGGGKTTILGAAACAYRDIAPGRFFSKSGRFDDSMHDWRIDYEILDRKLNPKQPLRRTTSFSKTKWSRHPPHRDVLVFGVARTVPATERADLRQCASLSFEVDADKIEKLQPAVIGAVSLILGKDISGFTHMKVRSRGNVTLLAGVTQNGVPYSEFHFGAGESSIIRMAMRLETAHEDALVLIEEIENGLHPVATVRMVEYLVDVAKRKRAQVIFTTHSEDALLPLPPDAIWAAVDRRAFQGRLSIRSLRAISSQIEARLAIFTEDAFATDWIRGMLRSQGVDVDLIEIHPMLGDGTAVAINRHHNRDPSRKFPSVCLIDGDSSQSESASDAVYRLPGEGPESTVFSGVVDRIDDCAAKLTVALHCKYEDEEKVRRVIEAVKLSNRDPHLLFSQIGERLGLISEMVVRGAFISVWCALYADNVRACLAKFADVLPRD